MGGFKGTRRESCRTPECVVPDACAYRSRFIIGVIVVAGVLVGMSTYDLDDDVIEVTL